ncbi:lysozyme [Mucilaginibacter glaciei]|uniref:Lysozyme n=1 Tax=Mucilaginibacter glaciei TaxID=2772109 RepID=A0A926NYZ9_9SPHI|nr:lysozyme [Mucilaginibacter glaciei]MBD1394264.1 lysozyme [Mucilaginibacter glaciei]
MIQIAIPLVTAFKNTATKAWAVDQNDKDLIGGQEGLRLKAYLDIAGVPTIGWGNTRYQNGTRVKMADTISRAQADELLLFKMKEFEADVRRLTKVAINDNQGAALLSLIYNIGVGAFAGSTLLKKLNAGDYAGASAEFLKWNKVTQNGLKVVSKTLTNRRTIEQALFNKAA